MNDRELLSLAAKAAGYRVMEWVETYGDYYQPDFVGFMLEDGARWNPLTDDGDALRLAVKLGIRILHTSHESATGYPNAVRAGTFEYGEAEEMHDDHGDCTAAVRRAIVRAAALIGESMQ